LHLALLVIDIQLLVNNFPLPRCSHQPLTNIEVLEMRSSLIIMKLLTIIAKVDSFVINKIRRCFVSLVFLLFIFLFLFRLLLLFGSACGLLQLSIRLHIRVVFMLWLGDVLRLLLALVHLVPCEP